MAKGVGRAFCCYLWSIRSLFSLRLWRSPRRYARIICLGWAYSELTASFALDARIFFSSICPLTILQCQHPALKPSCCVNHLLMYVQGSSQGSSASSSCYRPVIDEDRLQDHACTLFTKVCIDQVRIKLPEGAQVVKSPAQLHSQSAASSRLGMQLDHRCCACTDHVHLCRVVLSCFLMK